MLGPKLMGRQRSLSGRVNVLLQRVLVQAKVPSECHSSGRSQQGMA